MIFPPTISPTIPPTLGPTITPTRRPFFSRRMILWLSPVILLATTCLARGALLTMTLYNTVGVEDEVGTPLLGNAISGDLVQLFSVGPNFTIDTVNVVTGHPGDDEVFGLSNTPTFIGAGTFGPGNNSGLTTQININFDDSLVGSSVYVRFWNGSTIASSSYYGTSPVLIVPAPTLGTSFLDFSPTGTGPYTTDQPFSFAITYVPEPNTVMLLLGACMAFIARHQFYKWSIKPHHLDPVPEGPEEVH